MPFTDYAAGIRPGRMYLPEVLCHQRSAVELGLGNLEATLLFVDFPKTSEFIHRGKMEQILLVYGLLKGTVAAIMILNKKKVKVCLPDGDTDFFDIVANMLQEDSLVPYLFIICLDCVLQTSRDLMKENSFSLAKERSRQYPAQMIMDADYADDIAPLVICICMYIFTKLSAEVGCNTR